MMAGCAAESSRIKSYCIKWLSFIVLKTLSKDETSIFRNLEKLEVPIIKLISHLDFNQTCYDNKPLPTYTNIYIYIYIYIYIGIDSSNTEIIRRKATTSTIEYL